MGQVWEKSQQKGSALLLLLAIADFADDRGVAWPSVGTLAKKIRMGERYVQRLLADLVKTGELRIEEQAAKKFKNRYIVLVGVNPSTPLDDSTPQNPSSARGEPQFAKGVNPSTPEPLKNHQEPSAALDTLA
ncbi:MAG TPA: helix-turn-helix domain-containing protein, partial [Streptosporangiaceae bacterium]